MSISKRPRVLFFGGASPTAGTVLLVDSTKQDAEATFAVFCRTNPLVAAEPTMEVVVYASYLVVELTDTDAPLTLRVRLRVDYESPLIERTVTFPATTGERVYRREIAWSEAVQRDGIARARVAPRGFMAQIEVESIGAIPDGRITIDGIETELELLGESIAAVAT